MYENADELEWGRNLGCDFVKKSCFEWMATRQQRYLFRISLMELDFINLYILFTLSLLMVTCRLLRTCANSLDPDQARQNVGPDLDPNYLTFRRFPN